MIASQGIHDGGSYIARTPCQCLHGPQEAQRLSGSVRPGLEKLTVQQGRYFWRPSQVYRGTQSAVAVNWSGGHSTRRPSLLRMGSQCSVITLRSSVSDAAVQGMKRLEFSMSLLEGEAPAFNPRRLPLTLWTHS